MALCLATLFYLSGLAVDRLPDPDGGRRCFDGVLELEGIFVQSSSMMGSGFDVGYSIASDRTSVVIAFHML
ncbi:hypothetical protein CEXT_776321 [Caerostris extrusa]|uniref:Uncharacterized protein n=1 Tax=Caerostris extrusa TaxID=172846 RepID=A0AAV4NGW2_CAEEX|nr:hypothetical protein CEXT_776321 [Caerostris extrusa]